MGQGIGRRLARGSNYKTGHWLVSKGKDLDATIDLKEPTEIQKVSFNTNVVKGDWIMGASAVTVKVSDDGKNFKRSKAQENPGADPKRQGRIISPRDILRPGKGPLCRGYHQQRQTTENGTVAPKSRILVRR